MRTAKRSYRTLAKRRLAASILFILQFGDDLTVTPAERCSKQWEDAKRIVNELPLLYHKEGRRCLNRYSPYIKQIEQLLKSRGGVQITLFDKPTQPIPIETNIQNPVLAGPTGGGLRLDLG